MRVYSYAWSLPVRWVRWWLDHSIHHRQKPHTACKLYRSNRCVIETELLSIQVLHSGHRDFFYLFCSCDLDQDPMTFTYELDPYSLRCTRWAKKNFLCRLWQTYTLEILCHTASRVVNYSITEHANYDLYMQTDLISKRTETGSWSRTGSSGPRLGLRLWPLIGHVWVPSVDCWSLSLISTTTLSVPTAHKYIIMPHKQLAHNRPTSTNLTLICVTDQHKLNFAVNFSSQQNCCIHRGSTQQSRLRAMELPSWVMHCACMHAWCVNMSHTGCHQNLTASRIDHNSLGMDRYPAPASGSSRFSTNWRNPPPAGLYVARRVGFSRITLPRFALSPMSLRN